MLPLSERRPPGARRFALSAWVCALSLAVLAAVVLAVTPPSRAAASAPAKTSTTPITSIASATSTTSASLTPQVSVTPFKARENYYCTRIPALVTSTSGVLLAFAEGRTRLTTTGCHDVGDNDIVLKRSLDGGATWEALKVVVGAGDALAHGNPSPVVDAASGRITLLYSSSDWNRDAAKPSRSGFARTVHAVHSTDGGVTWSAGVELPQLKAAGWGWVSTGPGHGIQLDRGPHQGRLIVPGDHTAGNNTTAGAHLSYSDDGGLTWALGATTAPMSKSGAYPAELTVAQTVDGGVYVNARNSEPTRCATNEHRLETTSADGGATFAAPFTPVANLDTSPTFGSLLRLHAQDRDGKPDRLLYSGPSRLGPSPLEDRRELAVRSSYDEGKTWKTVGTLISPARTGYSDLALLSDGSIGVLYETAGNIPHGNVAFTAFTEQNMDAAATELRRPRTGDTRERAPGEPGNHAVIHGGATLGARGGGKAMEFDGQDDYLRLVCSPSLRVDDQDFTVTAWFRHSATTGTLPIVWAYGMPGTDPLRKGRHFSVRAEPGSGNVLRATVGTDIGSTEVTLPSSYNDGAWHHVVFTRQGLTLGLAVDGGVPATGVMPAGGSAADRNVTPGAEFNIHIGARPDFPNQPAGVAQLFRGTLDDVRLFGAALTESEAAEVRAGSLAVATDKERLRLGFTTIW
ncbi:exo-alpha-sialidase [Streptomyces sp. NPDC056943]|uniref:exo-alpha-sialidase n=1 Tax=Streptomyces sp. NPDC056943 TaxID=3345971 RepID=UPI00362CC146